MSAVNQTEINENTDPGSLKFRLEDINGNVIDDDLPPVDPKKLFGLSGLWKGGRSAFLDFFGFDSPVDKVALDTNNFLKILQTDTLTKLQTALPGKESKWLAQQYKALTIKGFRGGGVVDAKSKIEQLSSYLDSVIKSKMITLNSSVLLKDKIALQEQIRGLSRLNRGWIHILNGFDTAVPKISKSVEPQSNNNNKTDKFKNMTLTKDNDDLELTNN